MNGLVQSKTEGGEYRGTPFQKTIAGEPCFSSKQACAFFGWSYSKLVRMRGLARKGEISLKVKQEIPGSPWYFPCEDAYKFYKEM